MKYFAKVLDNKVIEVIDTEPPNDSTPGEWIETDCNTYGGVYYDPKTGEPAEDQSKALRKNFAEPGFTYDGVRDAFIPLKVFDSWTLDEFSCLWYPPIPKPKDGREYLWDEVKQKWHELQVREYKVCFYDEELNEWVQAPPILKVQVGTYY